MKYIIENKAEPKRNILTLSGPITSYEDEGISAKEVNKALENLDSSKELVIKLTSPGGDAFEGIQIYNILKNFKSKVTIELVSLVASAGSIIAMASDKLLMHTGSTLMIHEASTGAYGTKSDVYKTLQSLEKVDESLIDIYAERTGKDPKEIHQLMVNETWFTPDEAIQEGFADGKIGRKPDKEVSNKMKKKNKIQNDEVLKYIAHLMFNAEVEEDEEELEEELEETEEKLEVEERLLELEENIIDILERLESIEKSLDGEEDEQEEDENEEDDETERQVTNSYFYL